MSNPSAATSDETALEQSLATYLEILKYVCDVSDISLSRHHLISPCTSTDFEAVERYNSSSLWTRQDLHLPPNMRSFENWYRYEYATVDPSYDQLRAEQTADLADVCEGLVEVADTALKELRGLSGSRVSTTTRTRLEFLVGGFEKARKRALEGLSLNGGASRMERHL